MPKLIRADYQPPVYLISDVHLSFNIEKGNTTVTGVMQYKLNNGELGAPLVLDGGRLNENEFNGGKTKILSASINGTSVLERMQESFDNEFQTFTISDVPREGVLIITTQIDPWQNPSCEGLYATSDGMLFTQCEAVSFRKMMPFIDRPDNLAKYTVELEADEKQFPVLLSNGNLIASQRFADTGRHKVTYEDPFPKPSYLFAIVGGNLACVSDHFITKSGRKVNLFVHIKPELVGTVAIAMQALKDIMAWDEQQYDLEYDLDNCHLVAASSFNAGAMENKGLIIFNDKYLIADPRITTDAAQKLVYAVIAHEYFHNYAGNRVTVRQWLELALKEGLATRKETDYSADKFGYVEKRIETVNTLRTSQFAEDAGPEAHAVRPDEVEGIDNVYSDTIYEKGAELLSMFSRLLGRKTFTEGVKLYFKRHDGCAVTIEDFVKAQEDASGRDLQQFLEWYKQPGTPKLEITESYDSETKVYQLHIKQSNVTEKCSTNPPMLMPIAVGLLDGQGQDMIETQMLELSAAEQTFTFSDITEKPIPSLLRNFSAPVIITKSPVTQEMQEFLFQHDSDPVNRWLAGQAMMTRLIKACMSDTQQTDLMPFISACKNIIEDSTITPGLKAMLLELPSLEDIIAETDKVDIDRLVDAHKFLQNTIANVFKDNWYELYNKAKFRGHDELSVEYADRRAMQNLALYNLLRTGDQEAVEMALQQYNTATNMTTRLGAFRSLVSLDYPNGRVISNELLNDFYEMWKDQHLVLQAWFSSIALSDRSDTIDKLQRLFVHPAFDIKVPNHVYRSVGDFCWNNTALFHSKDGSGYKLVADKIIEVMAFNPSVAARLLAAFAHWKKYDSVRMALMQEHLLRIKAAGNLSTSMKESLDKMLEGVTVAATADAGFTPLFAGQKVLLSTEEPKVLPDDSMDIVESVDSPLSTKLVY